jgi:hypothetical protein
VKRRRSAETASAGQPVLCEHPHGIVIRIVQKSDATLASIRSCLNPRPTYCSFWLHDSKCCYAPRAGRKNSSPNAHPYSAATSRIWSAAIGILPSGLSSSWRTRSMLRFRRYLTGSASVPVPKNRPTEPDALHLPRSNAQAAESEVAKARLESRWNTLVGSCGRSRDFLGSCSDRFL